MSLTKHKVVERNTFIEVQEDADDTSPTPQRMRRPRALSDSVVDFGCGVQEVSDNASSESTCDGLDSRRWSISTDARDEVSSASSTTPPMGSPRESSLWSSYESDHAVKDLEEAPHAAPDYQQGSWQGYGGVYMPVLMASPMMDCSMAAVWPCFPQQLYDIQAPVVWSEAEATVQHQQQRMPARQKQASWTCRSAPRNDVRRGSATAGGSGAATTVILRNLPEECTISILLETLDIEGFAGAYDFVYVPRDFTSGASCLYALINLTDHALSAQFVQHFQGFNKWAVPGDASQECTEASWSTTQQGLEAHIQRYRNSPVMHAGVSDQCKPVLFRKGRQIAFPPPTVRIKAPRVRGHKRA